MKLQHKQQMLSYCGKTTPSKAIHEESTTSLFSGHIFLSSSSIMNTKNRLQAGEGGWDEETVMEKKMKHRQNEKQRHRNMTESLEMLQNLVPGRPTKETQISALNRVARYTVFLRKLEALLMMSGEIVADLEALYQESVDEVNNLNQAFMSEGSPDGLPLGRFIGNK